MKVIKGLVQKEDRKATEDAAWPCRRGCPDCGKAPGIRCVRLSGLEAIDFHQSRKADTVFIEQHGPDASIEWIEDDWIISSHGRADIRPQPERLARRE